MGEVIAVFIEGGNRQQVVLIRQVDDMDQGNGGGVLDSGIRVEGELLGDKAADVGDVGVQLQAAHIATGAPGSNKVDSGMADFSTLPPVAMVQVVVEHRCRTSGGHTGSWGFLFRCRTSFHTGRRRYRR